MIRDLTHIIEKLDKSFATNHRRTITVNKIFLVLSFTRTHLCLIVFFFFLFLSLFLFIFHTSTLSYSKFSLNLLLSLSSLIRIFLTQPFLVLFCRIYNISFASSSFHSSHCPRSSRPSKLSSRLGFNLSSTRVETVDSFIRHTYNISRQTLAFIRIHRQHPLALFIIHSGIQQTGTYLFILCLVRALVLSFTFSRSFSLSTLSLKSWVALDADTDKIPLPI